MGYKSNFFMKRLMNLAPYCGFGGAASWILFMSVFVLGATAHAAILSVSGTISIESNPYPAPSDTVIFVFDEQRGVAFVATQPLEFGTISPGTLVDSHYLQFDPAAPTGSVGAGTVTFDGTIIGIITATNSLNADLSPDVTATSDSYFGLEDTLGTYPTGSPAANRGLGSPGDDVSNSVGLSTLTIDSLDVPTPGSLDGIRVLTLSTIPIPAAAWLFGSAIGLLGWITRKAG